MSQLGLTARNLTAHGPSLPGARVFPPGNRTFVLVPPPARPHRQAARQSPALRRRRLLRQGPGGTEIKVDRAEDESRPLRRTVRYSPSRRFPGPVGLAVPANNDERPRLRGGWRMLGCLTISTLGSPILRIRSTIPPWRR